VITPLVEDAIRAEQKDEQQMLARSDRQPQTPCRTLVPGQYHGQDNDGYADPQLECVLET
jgi:hypothetical protein